MISEEQRKKYWEMYTEAWKLFDKFKNTQEADLFWEILFKESKELNEKHQSELFKAIILATLNEIEKLDKLKGVTHEKG